MSAGTRESDEAAGMILFGLVHAVVDQAADSNVWLIEARAAGEHRNVDACLVHHSHMCRKIGEQRIEPVIWIAVFVEPKVTGILAALHQLRRCIMMMKINNQCNCSEWKADELSTLARGRAGRLRHTILCSPTKPTFRATRG